MPALIHKDNKPIYYFKNQKEFEKWLGKNFNKVDAVWLRFYKKNSGVKSVNYAEALDVALCYGWIDGLVNKYDNDSYLQRFTPRRPRSLWSRKNIENTERLIATGKMKAPGLKEIEKAKEDGRWAAAYDSSANMEIPEDLKKFLDKSKKIKTFFESLNKTNKFAIVWSLQTAKKPETRKRRFKIIMEMLKKGEKFH